MPLCGNDSIPFALPVEAVRGGRGLSHRHGKCLLRHRVPILVATEANFAHGNAGVPCQLCGYPARVCVAFLDREQQLSPCAIGFEAEDFIDTEVVRDRA